MKIILLDKVSNLGKLGDIVCVKSGYARNFLIPKNKAVLANKKNIDYFKLRFKEIESKLNLKKEIAQNKIIRIKEIGSITFKSKVSNEGKLFGSIGVFNIIKAMKKLGINLIKKEIHLPNGNLRTIGNHNIIISLHSEVCTNFSVSIIPEI